MEQLKARAVSKTFWLTLIPQLILLSQLLGWDMAATFPVLNNYELIINVVFGILATLGIYTNHVAKESGD